MKNCQVTRRAAGKIIKMQCIQHIYNLIYIYHALIGNSHTSSSPAPSVLPFFLQRNRTLAPTRVCGLQGTTHLAPPRVCGLQGTTYLAPSPNPLPFFPHSLPLHLCPDASKHPAVLALPPTLPPQKKPCNTPSISYHCPPSVEVGHNHVTVTWSNIMYANPHTIFGSDKFSFQTSEIYIV